VREPIFARPQVTLPLKAWGIALLMLLPILGCGEEGQVRVSDQELPGTYTTEFPGPVPGLESGKEQLTLHSDKSFVQVFWSPRKHFTNRGRWRSENEFLGGTAVILDGASCREDGPAGTPVLECAAGFSVHRVGGVLKLAVVAEVDWYYDRVAIPRPQDILGNWTVNDEGYFLSSTGRARSSGVRFRPDGTLEADNLPVSTLDNTSGQWGFTDWTGTGTWSVGDDDGTPVVNVRVQTNAHATAAVTQFIVGQRQNSRILYYFRENLSSRPRLELLSH
jgi:hypothetical protein